MPKAAKCANPLFLRWVQEFHDEKDYRKRGGPPRATGYENAVRALETCNTRYEHPKELSKLSGIGPTCVSRLTEKLEEHCEQKGAPMPEAPGRRKRAPTYTAKKSTKKATATGRTKAPLLVSSTRELTTLDTDASF